MDILTVFQGSPVLLAVGIACLCCVLALVLGFGLQIIGVGIEVISSVFELIFGLFGAGPVPGCGCIVVGGGCALILLLAYLLVAAAASCETNPTQFCTLIGR
ncbi:MAG: hypothetical protein L6Q98_08180 [Anaerolineae bacterium]|nr:hypothetical protein [Anaerolineae bacterium]NUQ02567.1 hypothetical protein [Anaerolineae bacterium]